MIGTLRNKFWLLTGEGRFVKHFSISARNKTREAIDTCYEASAVSWNCETGIWPEFSSNGIAWDLRWALESNDSCNQKNEENYNKRLFVYKM